MKVLPPADTNMAKGVRSFLSIPPLVGSCRNDTCRWSLKMNRIKVLKVDFILCCTYISTLMNADEQQFTAITKC
jgi:hypothetical protein